MLIAGGDIKVVAGGGSSGILYENASTKGIKGVVNTIIDDGIITVSSSDDALHSNGNLSINGGTFTLATKNDGIHSDAEVTINEGEINITKSYEGIESAVITINGGNIHIVSNDDGLNVAGGNDGSGGFGGPGGGGGFDAAGEYYMYLKGGYVFFDAYGDGIDSNGYVEMTGGEIIVIGPTSNANSAIDYNGSFKISGGFIVAAGSSGMAQTPGSGSSQYSLLLTFSTKQAGTLVHMESSDGEYIVIFEPTRRYQSVAFSSPDLKNGST